jgi:hypothetical protein
MSRSRCRFEEGAVPARRRAASAFVPRERRSPPGRPQAARPYRLDVMRGGSAGVARFISPMETIPCPTKRF